jgi:nucleoside-diphosphate-sugar epimerase
MSKTVLIIGGNGYIGSRLIHDLHTIYTMHSVDVCWFDSPLSTTELKDYRTLTKEEVAKYDAVVLLAGHSSVKMCDGPIISSWNNNINNFIDLVNKLDKSQLLIYASSGSVYGSSNEVSAEDIPLKFKPINNYDLTKYSLDLHAQKFIKEGYKIVGLRFGTVNGWSPNTREELMINSMTKKSLHEGAITVSNKMITRPILGISDLSSAVRAIIDNPKFGIYNLSSFVDTVENISSGVSRILNSKVQDTLNTSGAYDFVMDTTKFKQTYDFLFNASIDSIVQELVDNFEKINFSDRNRFINYD